MNNLVILNVIFNIIVELNVSCVQADDEEEEAEASQESEFATDDDYDDDDNSD